MLLHRRRKRSDRSHGVRWKTAIAVVMFALPPPARADEVTAKDVQVIGRALGFMEDLSRGSLDLGIVYVRGDADSARQAHALQDLLGAGLLAGKIELHPRLVASDQLGALDQIGALFIVPAAHGAAAAAAAAAQRLHVPTISTDAACAEAGQCVIAFRSDPTVEIVFSRAAAAGASVKFTPAFRMLVKQV